MPTLFGRQGKKKKIKAMLYITPDALRVVEDSTKALLLDQTIEKVSFCAPDRNYDRAFSYICRDGTTRRWLCHSFFAIKESGERLSHAVGCAFAACLEKKQKREKEGVSATYDTNRTTFAREGSFKVKTLTEQAEENRVLQALSKESSDESDNRVKVEVYSSAAIPRPHAPAHLVRQASMRPLSHKNRFKEGGDESLMNHSPFKRNLSLQIGKLPSSLARCEIMNPVPEQDEPVLTNGSETQSARNNDDPFARAPPMVVKLSMPSAAASGGVNSILQPVPAGGGANSMSEVNGGTNNLINLQPSSPIHDTNPWANHFPHQQQQGASQADEWLKTIEQQMMSNVNNTQQPQQQQQAFHFSM